MKSPDRWTRTFRRLALLATLAAAPALAQSPPPCTCRGPRGDPVELGGRACLRAQDGQWRVHVCGMALNNTSWSPTPEPCAPTSRRDLARPARML